MTFAAVVVRAWEELSPVYPYRPGDDSYYAEYQHAIDSIAVLGPGQHTDTLLAESQRIHDAEAARRESLNTRAGALIGTIGLLGSLVVAGAQITIDNNRTASGGFVDAVVALLVVSLSYLGVSLVWALTVQGDKQGSVIDPVDLDPNSLHATTADEYKTGVAVRHLGYTRDYYKLNGRLKHQLLLAQRCLRNGVLAIIAAGILSPWALGH